MLDFAILNANVVTMDSARPQAGALGIKTVGSSDALVYFPHVESNPFHGIKAAVTRETEQTGQLLAPEEAITLEQALRMYTIDAAYAAYEESLKGSLERGMLTDFVVLDRDPFAVTAQELDQVQVDLTFIGGQKVYERDPKSAPRSRKQKAYFREVEKLFQ
jgi:predicted amidohydrolase YtcJ